MPKARPARSLFSSLPLDLKHSLRSQPTQSIAALDTVEVKAELIADTVQFAFLPTQPQSPYSDVEDVIPIDLTEMEAEAEVSTLSAPAVKRIVPDTSFASSSSHSTRKKRKGNSKVPENLYIGHPYDCTGLVPRYSDYSALPEGLAKCTS